MSAKKVSSVSNEKSNATNGGVANSVTGARAKIARLSDETLAGSFAKSFKNVIGAKDSVLEIPNVEFAVKREAANPRPTIEASVFEMAGSTSKDQVYKKEKGVFAVVAKSLAKIRVELPDGSTAMFGLEDGLNTSSTSFILCYRLD